MLQCSGGPGPCSARETFQALSPLSRAIHPNEYSSPMGWGEETCEERPEVVQKKEKLKVGETGQAVPSDLVTELGLG